MNFIAGNHTTTTSAKKKLTFNSDLSLKARSSLDSDLSDTALTFWTTDPNLLFVATLSRTGQVVGCIGYQEMSQKEVEMSRLSVDPVFRGLGIGKRLVQELLDAAKENGYETVLAITTSPQLGAIKLYEKMNFKYLGKSDFPSILFTYVSGLRLLTFSHEL